MCWVMNIDPLAILVFSGPQGMLAFWTFSQLPSTDLSDKQGHQLLVASSYYVMVNETSLAQYCIVCTQYTG